MIWREGPGWRLYQGDSRDMHVLEDGRVQLALTSPPYFGVETEPLLMAPVTKQTEIPRVRSEVSAHAMGLAPIFTELWRVVRATGFLVVHTRDVRYGRTLIQLAGLHRQIAEAAGFELRTRVFWRRVPNPKSRSHAFARRALSGAFEVDDLDEFLVFQKPGSAQALIRDVTPEAALRLAEPLWEFPPMGGAGTHPYQSPAEAMRRFIELLSQRGDLVLDPFAGHGTTLRCAVALGREAVGWEIDEDCFAAAARAIKRVETP